MTEPWEASARQMVEGLGPLPAPIAAAMRSVPRHWFVPRHLEDRAYLDEPIPLSRDYATVSAPHMVALQLEAAGLTRGAKLLEIGSGSGYLLAVAAHLVRATGHLVGVEVDAELAGRSRHTLARLGVDATIRIRDGRESVPEGAVFDAVLVSCASTTLYPAWIAALADGGRLVAPIGSPHEQVLTTYRRTGDRGSTALGPACRFVPLRPHI
ncbi:MAG TPA: protein-L-isoaspartate O-methyltransferase [Thermoplasmata archaeon]|nr:protein-L-isoaspartate O-methyltransferase [Thermoplasmata archaeon]